MYNLVSRPICTWTEDAECPRCAWELMENDAIFMNFVFVKSVAVDEAGYCICSRPEDAHVLICKNCDAILALSNDDESLPRVTLCRTHADIKYLGLTHFAETVRAERHG